MDADETGILFYHSKIYRKQFLWLQLFSKHINNWQAVEIKKRIPVLNGRKILSFNNRRSFLPVSMAVSTNKIDPGVAFVVNNMDLILL